MTAPYNWNSAFASLGQPTAFNWLNGPTAMAQNVPSYLDMGSFNTPQANPFDGINWGQPGPGAVAPGGGGGGLLGWLGDYNNLGTAVQGIGALSQAYLGMQGLKQAREGLRFQKEAFNANLNNSIKSYNTSLEDRIRGRTSDYEGKERDIEQYLSRHRLTR